jgi:GGDEF domain-containing protein
MWIMKVVIVISIKKLVDNQEAQEALRVVQLLLQGMARHAIVGDPADHARFQAVLKQIVAAVSSRQASPALLVHAGAAIQALEDYNSRTQAYLRLPQEELQRMVKMLAGAVMAVATAGETNLQALREIEQQVASAAAIEDVRAIRSKLADCLEEIRRERDRQGARNVATLANLQETLEGSEAAEPQRPQPVMDLVTRLESRRPAEVTITQACQTGKPAFVAVLVIERMQSLNRRFGYDIGDDVLRNFAQRMRLQFGQTDKLFRWTGPALVALLDRPPPVERPREEIRRLMECRFEHTVQTPSRTILLPISVRWTVLPVMAATRLLFQKIDGFISAEAARF